MIFEVDGHAIDYELRGSGPTVILLHGLTVDRRVLIEACEPALSTLPVRRLYLDLPGHGASRGDASRAAADDLVRALGALVRHVMARADGEGDGTTMEAPLLFGYSYGGYLAQGLVNELGGARGLFLCCPVVEPDFAKRTQPPRRVAERAAELAFSDDPREREAFEEVAVRQTPELLAAFQRAVHPANIAVDGDVVAAVRARYLLSRPYLGALRDLEGPVSIVCGRDDHWAGFEDAARLVRLCARPTFTVLPDCGNLLPLEAPGAFRRLLTDWLRVV